MDSPKIFFDPLHQFVTAPGAIAEAEKDPAPAEGTLPSGASTIEIIDEEGEEEEENAAAAAASDPDEGPSELPDNIGSPTKHKRPGKRSSKKDHKFEAEKRKRKQEEKKAEGMRAGPGVREPTGKSEEGNE